MYSGFDRARFNEVIKQFNHAKRLMITSGAAQTRAFAIETIRQ